MLARHHVFALLASLVLAPSGLAAEVRGLLSKIDLEKKELVVDLRGLGMRGAVTTFHLDRDTAVLFGRQQGRPEDLAPGQRVRLDYQPQEGKALVRVVHVFGPKPAPARTMPGDAVTGTLIRVAITDREIVVIGPGEKGPETETTFAVPEATKVTRAGATIALADLKDGERVAVRGEKRDGRWTAQTIQVIGEGEAPTKPTLTRLREVLRRVDQVLELAERQMEKKR